MKILVTGAAGFIAHRTCEMLLDMGHYVIGIDNLNDYYDVTLKDYRVELIKKHEVKKYILASTSSLFAGLYLPQFIRY